MNNNNEDSSINDFDFSLICEYFSSIKRQGPGSDESTLKALSFLNGINDKTRIADIGCGTGSSALLLAKHTDAHITALDLFPDFIKILEANAKADGIDAKINTIIGSMEDLPFKENEFDIIWSEGAIYNIGFKRGLKEWRKYIKEGGYIVITDASWLTDERPKEIEKFWNDAYPDMDTIPNKIAQLQSNGYRLVAVFTLPNYCWEENFYIPQKEAQRIFLEKHKGNDTAELLIQNQRHEAELFEKHNKYYGYVFYIGMKM